MSPPDLILFTLPSENLRRKLVKHSGGLPEDWSQSWSWNVLEDGILCIWKGLHGKSRWDPKEGTIAIPPVHPCTIWVDHALFSVNPGISPHHLSFFFLTFQHFLKKNVCWEQLGADSPAIHRGFFQTIYGIIMARFPGFGFRSGETSMGLGLGVPLRAGTPSFLVIDLMFGNRTTRVCRANKHLLLVKLES